MAAGDVVPAVRVNNVPDEATLANKSEPFTNGPDITQVSLFVTILHYFLLILSSSAIKNFFLFNFFQNQEIYLNGLKYFLKE